MKVIFSRKGFDSGYGGQPSPILPDGTMLSFPIPTERDRLTFSDVRYDSMSYYDIIHSLAPKSGIRPDDECHLDPDIRRDAVCRQDDWRPAFGQIDAARSHLCNQGVGVGDLFLFFGWFRHTEMTLNGLRYVGPSRGFHAIYGYMQVGEIIDKKDMVPDWLMSHPHAQSEQRWKRNNAIYIGAPTLSIKPSMPGAGVLNYNPNLILTKEGSSRSVWALPDFFKDIPITYNANAWKGDEFHSAAKGQEFVFTANSQVMGWLNDIIR